MTQSKSLKLALKASVPEVQDYILSLRNENATLGKEILRQERRLVKCAIDKAELRQINRQLRKEPTKLHNTPPSKIEIVYVSRAPTEST